MKLGFLLVTGMFFNLIMATIFPVQVLGLDLAISFLGEDYITSTTNPYLDSSISASTQDYISNTDKSDLENIASTEEGVVSNPISGISNFFDGLLDAMAKIGILVSFLVPFVTMFFLLPPGINIILGGMYSVVYLYAIIRFIRGV